jgi:flagellar basal-body rod modification protein FlgD
MAIDPLGGVSGSTPTSGVGTSTPTTVTSGTDALANENTFLKLFVAQLQNQDPMNPQDGTQFVAQLAQFSNLEQSLQMRTDLGAIRTDLDNYFKANSGTSGTGSTSTP